MIGHVSSGAKFAMGENSFIIQRLVLICAQSGSWTTGVSIMKGSSTLVLLTLFREDFLNRTSTDQKLSI